MSLRTRCWLQEFGVQELVLGVGETFWESPQHPGALAANRNRRAMGQPYLGLFLKCLVSA